MLTLPRYGLLLSAALIIGLINSGCSTTTKGPRGVAVLPEEQIQRLAQTQFGSDQRYAVGVSIPTGSLTRANWMLLIDLAKPSANTLAETLGVKTKAMSHFPSSNWWKEWKRAKESGRNYDHFFRNQQYDGYLHITLDDNGGRFNKIETDIGFYLVRFTGPTTSTTLFHQALVTPCTTVDAGNGLRYTDTKGCAEDIAYLLQKALEERLRPAKQARLN